MASGDGGPAQREALFSVWGFFRDEDAENAYRTAKADQIYQRARLTLLVGAVLFAAALPYDYWVFAGRTSFAILLAMRLGAPVVALAALAVMRTRGAANTLWPGLALLAFEIYISAAFLLAVLIHGGEISFHTMSAQAIVLVFYLFLPNLLPAQFVLPLVFSVVFVAMFPSMMGAPPEVLFIPLLPLMLANVLGLVFARLNNRAQRLEYRNLNEQRRLNHALHLEIEEREDVERLLRDSDENLRRLFDAAPVPLVLSSLDNGRVLRANDFALELFGAQGMELAELRARDFYHDPKERERLAQRVVQDGHVSGLEVRLHRVDGTTLEVLLAASRLEYHDTPALLVGVMDIAMQKRLVRQFKRLASLDPLTGVRNRRSFLLDAEQELRRASRTGQTVSIMVVDADDFKQINDRFGHAVGDVALRSIASALRGELREFDLLGRIGGEEFAILLPSLEMQGAMDVAERLRECVAVLQVETEGAETVRPTISIGVAPVDIANGGLDEALKRADQAMYVAKQEGRNRVWMV
ncbi:MAG: sensor domain-containing diguanylate cyclase [Acidihalobacter sp.]|uniref:GGDEF domain-containing protein n=1 Tax=Acidihalobacter sp. TaxID=1872108 RepID=UPI00307D1ECF